MSNSTTTTESTTTPTFSVNGRTAIQTNAEAALLVFNFGWIVVYATDEVAAKAICYANC